MPQTPRQINDRITEARLRQVIRSILDQEVKRLLSANASVQAQVTTNTGDIATNASNISSNDGDIEDLARRALARNNDGFVRAAALGTALATGTGGGAVVTETAFSSQQVWSIVLANQPIAVTLWSVTDATKDATFDGGAFDSFAFDGSVTIQSVNRTATVTYVEGTTTFSIDWGSAKTGTLYLNNIGSGDAFGVIAVSD